VSRALSTVVLGFILDVQALYDCIAFASSVSGGNVNQYICLPAYSEAIPQSSKAHNQPAITPAHIHISLDISHISFASSSISTGCSSTLGDICFIISLPFIFPFK